MAIEAEHQSTPHSSASGLAGLKTASEQPLAIKDAPRKTPSLQDADRATFSTASSDIASLPLRVREAISRHDRQSEVLIRVSQLLIVGLFGALYILSPKTSAGTAFTPVPYVLGAYTIIGILGLIWSLKAKKLHDLPVYILTAADVGLLYALIWSFHVQYDQPPSFYLKAPTFVHIFILISLRALRMQRRFVIAAGTFAVLGWLGMLAYAVAGTSEGYVMITRDYITYLTENSILVGAEFDKIFGIIAATTVLALAVNRGRSLLINAVTGQTAARSLSRFFDRSVASQIQSAEDDIQPGTGLKREAAILNIDIRGFSTMAAQMDASDVVSILAAYQERLVPIIQRHGGTIDKFMGDGIMATFGATDPSETYCADAMRSMDALVDEIGHWQHEPRLHPDFCPSTINLALASGPIVFGAVGSGERLEFTVIGAAVNLSAKLEKHNKAVGAVALSMLDTLRLAVDQGYMGPATQLAQDAVQTAPIAGVSEALPYVIHSMRFADMAQAADS